MTIAVLWQFIVVAGNNHHDWEDENIVGINKSVSGKSVNIETPAVRAHRITM